VWRGNVLVTSVCVGRLCECVCLLQDDFILYISVHQVTIVSYCIVIIIVIIIIITIMIFVQEKD